MRRTYLIFFIFFLAILLLFPVSSYTNDTFIGKVAPVFKVMSGDKKTLTLNDLKGKVAVLFYEAKSVIEQNRKLKTTLSIFYAEQPNSFKKDIVRIGVIDCHGVFFRGAWEKGLRDNSLKEGITIYGDWDGEMAADYRTTEDVSNMIIIDKKGIVRYYTSGQVEDKNFSIIEKLLDNLVKEK